MDHGVGLYVLEPEVTEAQLVETERWACLDEIVSGGAGVVPVAGKSELFGRGVASDRRPGLPAPDSADPPWRDRPRSPGCCDRPSPPRRRIGPLS
jgi:hypothetical protein